MTDDRISPYSEDFLIVELDERFEFGVAVIDDSTLDDNYGCNASNCVQNGYCPT
jgi:hypothetical protein